MIPEISLAICESKTPLTAWGGVRIGYLYTIHRDDTKSYREQLEENQSGEAIWPETIARFFGGVLLREPFNITGTRTARESGRR